MESCWQAGGYATKREAGHGLAGMEAQRFQGMAAMAKCPLPRGSFCILSISRARDHVACMLERQGLLLPTFFELTKLASDGQPRMVVSNLIIRLRILTCSCMA